MSVDVLFCVSAISEAQSGALNHFTDCSIEKGCYTHNYWIFFFFSLAYQLWVIDKFEHMFHAASIICIQMLQWFSCFGKVAADLVGLKSRPKAILHGQCFNNEPYFFDSSSLILIPKICLLLPFFTSMEFNFPVLTAFVAKCCHWD